VLVGDSLSPAILEKNTREGKKGKRRGGRERWYGIMKLGSTILIHLILSIRDGKEKRSDGRGGKGERGKKEGKEKNRGM